MIELENVDKNVKFKCQVVGYQFPNAKDNGDANWCLLAVDVTHGEKIFHTIDPAIETQDLIILYDWFSCLSTNTLPSFSLLEFTEPCISFEFLAKHNNAVRFSVNLSHELKPSFNICQLGFESNEWNIVFEINENGFEKVLTGLKDTIEKFPVKNKSNEGD